MADESEISEDDMRFVLRIVYQYFIAEIVKTRCADCGNEIGCTGVMFRLCQHYTHLRCTCACEKKQGQAVNKNPVKTTMSPQLVTYITQMADGMREYTKNPSKVIAFGGFLPDCYAFAARVHPEHLMAMKLELAEQIALVAKLNKD
jgi:hypothetical protein